MSRNAFYSPLLGNDGGGVLLVLPFEAVGAWRAGDEYETLLDRCVELVQIEPIGDSTGVVVNDMDGEGILAAHWMHLHQQPGVILVVWANWGDLGEKASPENPKQLLRQWIQGKDPRQAWLERQLLTREHTWQRVDGTQRITSGVLLLGHAEWPMTPPRLAHPKRFARCGQLVPIGITPGEYAVETLVFDEMPEGENYCVLCRWVQLTPPAATIGQE